MIARTELEAYLNHYLASDAISDYAPNGLQVEGRAHITRIAIAVTASLAVIKQAIEQNADALLVHHGYFWKGESPVLTGMKAQRCRALLNVDLNLFAYHLPLDVHLTVGNNASLAKQCDWIVDSQSELSGIANLLWSGHLATPMSLTDFAVKMEKDLRHKPIVIAGHDRPISRLAWCTGGAQRYINEAHSLGVDAYVSGEISENSAHLARELGLHFIAAGHHATERYGVQSLASHLKQQFDLECFFIDEHNPA